MLKSVVFFKIINGIRSLITFNIFFLDLIRPKKLTQILPNFFCLKCNFTKCNNKLI